MRCAMKMFVNIKSLIYQLSKSNFLPAALNNNPAEAQQAFFLNNTK